MKLLSQIAREGFKRTAVALLAVASVVALTGCETDSFVDQTVVGRWEPTPIVVPILDRLDVVEGDEEVISGLSRVTSEDLIHDVSPYELGPGDVVAVNVFELLTPNAETQISRRVDETGFVSLPVIGRIRAEGLTLEQLEQKIINILDPDILIDPQVSVLLVSGQQKTFKMIGGAEANGRGTRSGVFALVRPDFRLLDALAQSGGLSSRVGRVYIIRHIPLDPIVVEGFRSKPAGDADYRPPLKPEKEDRPASSTGDEVDPEDLISELTEELEAGDGEDAGASAEPGGNAGTATRPLDDVINDELGLARTRWVYLNGEWVKVSRRADLPESIEKYQTVGTGDPLEGFTAITDDGKTLPPPSKLWTQRVIEIDAQALMNGSARWNVVIRPNDIIRVPSTARVGNIYMGGQISRPGTFGLPPDGLTLKQAIISAGGFGPEGIPERVDLIRRIQNGTAEVTIRLNARAIFEGIQPDIYLKPNDTINVGSNFWAIHVQIFRNAFRQSYGIGFAMDRNFGSEVFGAN